MLQKPRTRVDPDNVILLRVWLLLGSGGREKLQ